MKVIERILQSLLVLDFGPFIGVFRISWKDLTLGEKLRLPFMGPSKRGAILGRQATEGFARGFQGGDDEHEN